MTSCAALGRLVEPTVIAKAVAFLASDDAAAITGITMLFHLFGGKLLCFSDLERANA